jgi:SAM-dependent methyltransferase
MMKIPTPEQAASFRSFFAETGYAEHNLRDKLGLSELPSSRLRNLSRLLDRTREASCLNSLLRWFWVGVPIDVNPAKASVPSWFLDLAIECGLLRESGGQVVPEAMLVPTDAFIVASDHTRRIEAGDPQCVLWPNPTSRLLSRFMVRRPSNLTLDLGTGNGVLALLAAGHSKKVIATDLNDRAADFAAFNVRLNGLENIEVLTGDAFQPVEGRQFDLVVSNPPFFITPDTRYLFCDNPLELDRMCRKLVRDAPGHLSEGGYFQMLCEWAQLHDQPWEERVSEWFDGIGCDAWVMKGHSQDPGEYAQERIRETNPSPERDAELYDSYMTYYRDRGVEAIHDGMVAVRKRSGKNWVLIEEVSQTPKDPFGQSVLDRFEARHFLQEHADDEQILQTRPKLSPDIRLEEVLRHTDGKWQVASLNLRLAKGLPYSTTVQPLVVEFLSGCDGSKTMGELVADLSTKVSAPADQVQKECTAIARVLIDRGFLTC